MKKFLIWWLLLITSICTFSAHANAYWLADFLDDSRLQNDSTWLNTNDREVVQYLYDNWMTIYSDFNQFRPYDKILRSEVTKFFVNFGEAKWFVSVVNPESKCNFKDVPANFNDSLRPKIKMSCVYWLFNWSNWKFNPYWYLTKWEALAVTLRMIDWRQPETWSHWAMNYLKRAKELNINLPSLKYAESNPQLLNEPITRVDMWRLLEGAEFVKLKVPQAMSEILN